MKPERFIACYKRGSGIPAHEMDISHVELDHLKSIFTPRPNDPYLYLHYDIHEHEARLLAEHAGVTFDFTKFYYSLDCNSGGQGSFPPTPTSWRLARKKRISIPGIPPRSAHT